MSQSRGWEQGVKSVRRVTETRREESSEEDMGEKRVSSKALHKVEGFPSQLSVVSRVSTGLPKMRIWFLRCQCIAAESGREILGVKCSYAATQRFMTSAGNLVPCDEQRVSIWFARRGRS